MPVVIVESPAKAKTINKYLGPDYVVLASYGHVRDLPAKNGSVDPDDDFAMKWEIAAESKKHIKEIKDALANDDRLILATDPDREGEAISWHLQEALATILKKGKSVERVTFNAITKDAVTRAMAEPRQIDEDLVDAYLARRALDYLVGFTLSPVLWRKLPGARSAGRVQSVCLRLIVEREMEIEAFKAREYWSVKALFTTPRGDEFTAQLAILDGSKLDKFGIANEQDASRAVAAVTVRDFSVASVESKPGTRNPWPPFMTSTLQQEAGRKCNMGAQQTMRAAQRLYEAGHITYMRTDGIDMAPEAITAARTEIAKRFGDAYVPGKPRIYKNKAKNAQEAHECIRPTDMGLDPARLHVEDDQRRLYELIWKRTIASQMEAARLERTAVDLISPDARVGLRANGQVVLFDGFLRIYDESRDDETEDSARLPQVHQGEAVARQQVTPEQHFTQPPPRYTEASLVKKMEELGIGRPSTYASILSTIVDRDYVRKEKRNLVPEDKGRLVTAFLSNFFNRYVEYDFTADLEGELDDVSAGERDYKDVLARFWKDFSAAIAETSDLRITEVLDRLDEFLAPRLYPPRADGGDPRLCPLCGKGQLHLKTSRSGGAFIGCTNYPDCRYTRPIAGDAEAAAQDDIILGADEDGNEISLRNGRFGPYIQRGEANAEQSKPDRASLPRDWVADSLTLEKALQLLSLPRLIGHHPEDGEPVETGIGRYGPFVHHGKTYANLSGTDEVFTLGMNHAVELLAQKQAGGRRRATAEPLKILGAHPDGGDISVMPGRYGPYVKWEKINATIPRDQDPETITMEEALTLISARAAKGSKKKAPAKKSAAAKETKKLAAKKAAPRTAAKPKTRKSEPAEHESNEL